MVHLLTVCSMNVQCIMVLVS